MGDLSCISTWLSCLSRGQTGPCCTVTVPPPKVPSVCPLFSLLRPTSLPPASRPLNIQVPPGCILLPAPAPHNCLHPCCALGSLALGPAFEVSDRGGDLSEVTQWAHAGAGIDPGAPASPRCPAHQASFPSPEPLLPSHSESSGSSTYSCKAPRLSFPTCEMELYMPLEVAVPWDKVCDALGVASCT